MSAQRDHVTYMGGPAGARNRSTPLGSILHARGITAIQLSFATGIHPRTLSDYLGNHVPIRAHHLPLITSYLRVSAAQLMVEPEGGYDGEKIKVINRQLGKDHARDRDLREEMVKPDGVARVIVK